MSTEVERLTSPPEPAVWRILTGDEDDVVWETSFSYDECGMYKEGYEPIRPNDPMYRMGVCTRHEISHPEYTLMSRRLKTFEGWPKEKLISGERMAQAGFFWTGKDDNVICYWCGGGINKWDEDIDEWVSHAKWFGRCSYMLEMKGMDYVENVHKQVRELFSFSVEIKSQ